MQGNSNVRELGSTALSDRGHGTATVSGNDIDVDPGSADTSMAATRSVQDVDRIIGKRMRERRIMLGLNQQQLAEIVGVTYQQAHKYERGVNRIAASRLVQIASALNVDVAWFFETLEGADPSPPEAERMLLDLARSFAAMPSQRHRTTLCELARMMAQECSDDDEAARAA